MNWYIRSRLAGVVNSLELLAPFGDSPLAAAGRAAAASSHQRSAECGEHLVMVPRRRRHAPERSPATTATASTPSGVETAVNHYTGDIPLTNHDHEAAYHHMGKVSPRRVGPIEVSIHLVALVARG